MKGLVSIQRICIGVNTACRFLRPFEMKNISRDKKSSTLCSRQTVLYNSQMGFKKKCGGHFTRLKGIYIQNSLTIQTSSPIAVWVIKVLREGYKIDSFWAKNLQSTYGISKRLDNFYFLTPHVTN